MIIFRFRFIYIHIYIYFCNTTQAYIYIYTVYIAMCGGYSYELPPCACLRNGSALERMPSGTISLRFVQAWILVTCVTCILQNRFGTGTKGKSDNVLCTSLLEIFGNMCSFQWILMIWFKSRYLDGMSYFPQCYISSNTRTHTQNIHTQYINVYNVFWIWLLDSFFTTKCSLGRRSWCSVRGKSDWWPWTAANVR